MDGEKLVDCGMFQAGCGIGWFTCARGGDPSFLGHQTFST